MRFHEITIAIVLLLGACAESKTQTSGDTTLDREDGDPVGDEVETETPCPEGTESCSGRCVDLTSDHANCGSCGNACGAAETCVAGSCVLECPPGETSCDGRCVDLDSDHEHCGSCVVSCAEGQVCSGGLCQAECASGLIECSGSCVDLLTSRAHCGTCDNACTPDEMCIRGVCTGGCGNGLCGAGETSCSCPADCGACTGCCMDTTCVAGTSTSACGSGGGVCDACLAGEVCRSTGCQCEGVTCGSACCTSGQVCISGSCCNETWSTTIASVQLAAMDIDSDGTIFVTGTDSSDQVYVASLGSCGGILRESHFMPVNASFGAGTSIVVGSEVFVAGNKDNTTNGDPQDGMIARLNKSTLSVTTSRGLYGSTIEDEVWDLVQASDGFLWTSGSSNISGSNRIWAVKISATTSSACGWGPLGTEGSLGRDAAAASGSIFMTGHVGGQMLLIRYFETSCSATASPCTCTPDWEARISHPTADIVGGQSVVVSGSYAYVAGFATTGSDQDPVIARISLSTGTADMWASAWHPSNYMDAYYGLSLSGSYLIGTGVTSYSGTVESARGFLNKVRLSNLATEWTVTPPGIAIFTEAETDSAGGIVAIGHDGSTSYVKRCLDSGSCP